MSTNIHWRPLVYAKCTFHFRVYYSDTCGRKLQWLPGRWRTCALHELLANLRPPRARIQKAPFGLEWHISCPQLVGSDELVEWNKRNLQEFKGQLRPQSCLLVRLHQERFLRHGRRVSAVYDKGPPMWFQVVKAAESRKKRKKFAKPRHNGSTAFFDGHPLPVCENCIKVYRNTPRTKPASEQAIETGMVTVKSRLNQLYDSRNYSVHISEDREKAQGGGSQSKKKPCSAKTDQTEFVECRNWVAGRRGVPATTSDETKAPYGITLQRRAHERPAVEEVNLTPTPGSDILGREFEVYVGRKTERSGSRGLSERKVSADLIGVSESRVTTNTAHSLLTSTTI
ncbi:hypothetical protein B0H16DRAFT_1471976 [Mycena metata]|uniref:Uncharacterized protein n=1 Tax=Mycena metata TaxID=1033252 RepID=A0AAD7HPB9_9AGAR|nr:hypothetical protein B0H16DRAFT_1471976 [Mycena metata]